MGPWLAYELQLQQNARQQILSMESSLKLLLARIQKFTSHTFHVFLRDLIPGAKLGRSLLFTRVVEHRNQYLAKNRTTIAAKEYSALDTILLSRQITCRIMRILSTLHGLPFCYTHGTCYFLCINGKLPLILSLVNTSKQKVNL